jgi:hypothetical protein
MKAIHRDDGELCGFVAEHDNQWRALAVFGGLLATAESEQTADRIVRDIGLAALAERWLLLTTSAPEGQVVCIQEASPQGVTVALDYYSMPGVPTRRITRAEIDSGECQLRRSH